MNRSKSAQTDGSRPTDSPIAPPYPSERLRIPHLSQAVLDAVAPDFSIVPYAEALRRQCVAVRNPQGALWVALANPHDAHAQDWLEEHVRTPFAYRTVNPDDLAMYLTQHETGLRAMEQLDMATEYEGGAGDETAHDISIEAISDTDSPVIKLVNSTIYDALKSGASDIHLEKTASGLCIKYRIDGVLIVIATVDGSDLANRAISRVKVLSELDIAERRVPQDGRFRVRHRAREIDFRVSIMPNIFGEDAVLRILDKRSLTDQLNGLTLEQLGFEPDIVQRLRALATKPYGMLLVTGPTGSGKTTTLYAVISETNDRLDKVITIEDPVEYQLPGALQIPVNEKKGLSFARGLRSILRHDPDRIMVGEIRDPETAEIAVQSALTGHLVYTTVHANNVFDVIGRFQHMGVDPFSLASALNAVVAQRLVRVRCIPCQGAGCAQCRGTGYRGRKAIAELLVLNDRLKDLIAERAPTCKLKEAARTAGTRSLREAALDLVKRGETTLEEINRVTFVER
jgi:general secretion pathway protein E